MCMCYTQLGQGIKRKPSAEKSFLTKFYSFFYICKWSHSLPWNTDMLLCTSSQADWNPHELENNIEKMLLASVIKLLIKSEPSVKWKWLQWSCVTAMRFRSLILCSSAEHWASGGLVTATKDGLETAVNGWQFMASEMQEVMLDNQKGLSSMGMY